VTAKKKATPTKSANKKAALPTKDVSGKILGRPNAGRTKTAAPKIKPGSAHGHVAGKLIHDGDKRKGK